MGGEEGGVVRKVGGTFAGGELGIGRDSALCFFSVLSPSYIMLLFFSCLVYFLPSFLSLLPSSALSLCAITLLPPCFSPFYINILSLLFHCFLC